MYYACFRFAGLKYRDVLRPANVRHELALQVVISENHERANVFALQTRELAHQKKRRVKIFPVAVEQVSCEHQKCCFFPDAKIDEIAHGRSRRLARELDRRTFVTLQSAKRTVDVKIGSVNEAHGVRILLPRSGGVTERGF